MFKTIKKLLQRNKKKTEHSTPVEPLIVDQASGSSGTETHTPKKGRTVLVFDAKKRVFVVKKRIARIALYNPSTHTFVLQNTKGEESIIKVPLEDQQMAMPLSGCWFDKDDCNIGFYVPDLEHFYLLKGDQLRPIRIDAKHFEGVGDYDKMLPLSGFWFDKEIETIGLYDPSSALFLLKHHDEQQQGQAGIFQYGPFKNHMQPLVGDWTGTGMDSVGLYDGEAGVFFLKHSLDSVEQDDNGFHFGPVGSDTRALVGDWDGTGHDKVALYLPQQGLFFFLLANRGAEIADINSYFGPAHKDLVALAGDWAGIGQEGIAVYDRLTGTAYLKNNCSSAQADSLIQFTTFTPDAMPLVVYELV